MSVCSDNHQYSVSQAEVSLKVYIDQLDVCFIAFRSMLIASVLSLSVCSSRTSCGFNPACITQTEHRARMFESKHIRYNTDGLFNIFDILINRNIAAL